MIYELALVARPSATDEQIDQIKDMVAQVAKDYEGEVLLTDDWGRKEFAQAASDGSRTGHFIYYIYKANAEANTELARRMKINEQVHKSLTVKLGEDEESEALIKAYKTPYSKAHNGSQTDDLERSAEKDKRKFAKRRTCWFTANKVNADWKDPKTYSWLINEFGKISPARVTGLRPKYQRMATSAIKRGRCMGLISYMSNNVAR